MKKLITLLAVAATVATTGCTSRLQQQEDTYFDAISIVCASGVKSYSTSDDGVIRIQCKDSGKVWVQSAATFEVIQNTEIVYCESNIHSFFERDKYYLLVCEDGNRVRLNK
ncbi:membrane lipoprotein [Vibrio phage 1.031.O._10N.261.46.F8]|nr:membrane lipoprotein [Vibrio phage 1.031.O._10N.261.46.F8]